MVLPPVLCVVEMCSAEKILCLHNPEAFFRLPMFVCVLDLGDDLVICVVLARN